MENDRISVTRGGRNNAGFTLIEILVVVLVSAMLTGIVITYSGTGRDTVSLSVKTVQIAQTLLRAKSLAVATYAVAGHTRACAYGVVFDAAGDRFSMVAYAPPAGTPCPSVSAVSVAGIDAGDVVSYSSSTWQVSLGTGVHFDAGGASLVLFYPPDPATLLSSSACAPGGTGCQYGFVATPLAVTVATNDGNALNTVTVGTAGQVSIQ